MAPGNWTGSRCLVVATALAALTACGGKSDSSDDDDSGSGTGGSATTSSGGSGDAGGGPGAGGTGGTSASGGSGGSAPSSTSSGGAGGSGTGGSGTGGSGTGGTEAAGGSGTTTTGAAGAGGTDPIPPPELVEGCQETCEAEVAAGCSSGPTASSCADGCNLTTRVPACADELASLFDCVGDNDTTSCSNEGEVVFDECVTEQFDAYACVLQEAPDPELEEPCENYCGAAVDAMCANDAGDLAGCILYCQSIGTTFPSCQMDWQNLLECGEAAEFECNASGDAEPVGCDAETLFFFACVCESDPTICE